MPSQGDPLPPNGNQELLIFSPFEGLLNLADGLVGDMLSELGVSTSKITMSRT